MRKWNRLTARIFIAVMMLVTGLGLGDSVIFNGDNYVAIGLWMSGFAINYLHLRLTFKWQELEDLEIMDKIGYRQ